LAYHPMAGSQDQRMEWEVRGGVWENLHVLTFYTAVTLAIIATAGVARFVTGILSIILLVYSIFTMYSSATFAIIDPDSKELRIEKYYYLLPLKRVLPADKIDSLLVKESARPPADSEEKASKRDLSYYVRIYALLKDGKRVKLFRPGMTGAPLENRGKAYLVTTSIAVALDIPVQYSAARSRAEARGMHLAGSSLG
jgi:hypothetical protein